MKGENEIQPTIFVILGITGDLAQNKLIPAIWNLYNKELLPTKFKLIGFGRKDLSSQEFENLIESSLVKRKIQTDGIKDFIANSFYVKGDFNDTQSYINLGKVLSETDAFFNSCANKLFYLATPPLLYETIVDNLDKSGLNIECVDGGWTRILIEKPFGHDLNTAQALDKKLGKIFSEKQIFRIDHYLAKETIRNIIAFRFANQIFEPIWNDKNIERIKIIFHENNDLAKRGNFYHDIGALRDVGQNHILQMLATVTMTRPEDDLPDSIRKSRAEILKQISLPEKSLPIRAQYDGFVNEIGVPNDSETETFFHLKAQIKNKTWQRTEIILESGKGLEEACVKIEVYFRTGKNNFCQIDTFGQTLCQNVLTFRVQPKEGINLLFWSKRAGLNNELEPRFMSFDYSHEKNVIPDAYEQVIYDCILGDQTRFASTDEVEASWSFVSQVLKAWQKSPILKYKKGSAGPRLTELND